MTAAPVLDPRARHGWRALVLRLLPWYDMAVEQERAANSEARTRRAIRARKSLRDLDEVRRAYRLAGERLDRQR